MRHRKAMKKLGRNGSHRKAMIRNLLTSLVEHERIETTHTRCKVLKREMDKLITYGKKGTLHHRRLAAQVLFRKDLVTKLFDELAPRYDGRPGGYSRVIPRGPRLGDGAPICIIELLGADEKVEFKKRLVKEPDSTPEAPEAAVDAAAEPEADAAAEPEADAAAEPEAEAAVEAAADAAVEPVEAQPVEEEAAPEPPPPEKKEE